MSAPQAEYSIYENYVSELLAKNSFDGFKRHPKYTYMLEHVTYNQGIQYLDLIQKTDITVEEIQEFCSKNDSVGNPSKYDFGVVNCSPSSIRYIYQAFLIVSYFKTFNQSVNIVELGGGYGGLFLAVEFFSKKYNLTIDSYTIIDLPVIVRFQEKYVNNFSTTITPKFLESYSYGSDFEKDGAFLISNYCFSEIERRHQEQYIKSLFPKISHGFITWNHIPLYDFGFKYTAEVETPQTGSDNKYIRF